MQPSSQTTWQSVADPMVPTFETALDARAQAMADACTRCGKCVEVCPVTEPGGLNAEELNNPAAVIGGVVDIVRTGRGNDAAFPNQHYNSITSWAVDGTGAIKHVYA